MFRIPFRAAALWLGFVCLLAFPAVSQAEYQEADQIPWSGYWWPYSQGGLGNGNGYFGSPSPIAKYEMLTRGHAQGPLSSWYFRTHYDPGALYWFGLCYEWAQAASYEDIRFFPSSENNIVFRVGDKKGLMTLAHESDLEEVGNGENPDEFHFWLLSNVKDHRRPFMADLDPTEEVWSYPIFSYDMRTERSGGVESVDVVIGLADDSVHPDYMGTKKRHQTYSYDLWVDESGNILGGEWTGISKIDHPQRMARPLAPFSNAPELDYQTVRRLAEARDDFLEQGEEPVSLEPGSYNLVLMDPDVYDIPVKSSDTVFVRVAQIPSSEQDIRVALTDGNGALLAEGGVNSGLTFSHRIGAGEPPYRVRVWAEDYSDPNIYQLSLDVRKSFIAEVPFLPNATQWSGFAITNPGETPVSGLHVVTFGEDGRPIQTVMGPRTLAPGQKDVFLFDDLPWRPHERSNTDRLMILADAPVRVLNLLGGSGGLACLVSNAAECSSRFVLHETLGVSSPDGISFGEILNSSPEEAAEVTLRLFSAEGIPESEASVWLDPGEKTTVTAGGSPFYHMPDGGWVDVLSSSNSSVFGFHYRKNGGNYEILPGLIEATGEMMVPHVPPPGGYWETTLTLVNLSDGPGQFRLGLMADGTGASDAVIVLDPKEKRMIDIGSSFGMHSGDPLFQSILTVSGDVAFTGFFTYAPRNGVGDSVSIPILGGEDVKSELVLPHCAGNAGQWWTGMVVGNAGTAETAVRVFPYDVEGVPMAENQTEFFLEPGRYYQGTVTALLGLEAARRVSYLVFRTDSQAPLVGFFTYGNTKDGNPSSEMMAGAPMR